MKAIELINQYERNYSLLIPMSDKEHLVRMSESIIFRPECAGSFCSAVANNEWETAATKADRTNARWFHYFFYLKQNGYNLVE